MVDIELRSVRNGVPLFIAIDIVTSPPGRNADITSEWSGGF